MRRTHRTRPHEPGVEPLDVGQAPRPYRRDGAEQKDAERVARRNAEAPSSRRKPPVMATTADHVSRIAATVSRILARLCALASGMSRRRSIAHLRRAPWRWENLRFCSSRGDCRSERQAQKGSPVVMRRSDVAARALLLAAGAFTAAALSAQSGAPALTADAMKPIAFRSLGPSLTTGRISDIAVDPEEPQRLVRRGGLGQPVEDREPRQHLDADLRRLRLLLARRGDRRPEGLERRLARHRREQQPAQRRASATASTSPPTPARRGSGWGSRTPSTSRTSSSIRATRTSSTSRAIGPLWSSGGDRGLYKTTDGGQTWKAVLLDQRRTPASPTW